MKDGVLFTLRVLLQNDDYIKKLEQDLAYERERAAKLERDIQRLQVDYKMLSHKFLEAIDTLKINGIKYRKTLDGEGYWSKPKG